MKKQHIPFYLATSAGLLLVGSSTPYQVKDLAQQTRAAASHMGDVHRQDLQTLAAYDRARVAQFNQLLSDYFSLRTQVLSAFNAALNQSKQASLAELDHAFDQRAEQMLTILFWSGFREEADKDLDKFLRSAKEKTVAKKAEANAYGQDLEAKNESLLAARQLYLATSLNYETVESSFAELVRKIDQARTEYHTANEQLFAQIRPIALPELPAEVKNFTLTNNTAEINQRLADLKDAYAKLDTAQGVLGRYFDENNPGADFFVSLGQAVVGVSDVSTNATSTALSVSPADPVNSQLPGLNGLFSLLTDRIKQVQTQQTIGASQLDQVVSGLINNSKPLIHLIPASGVSGSGAFNPTTNKSP